MFAELGLPRATVHDAIQCAHKYFNVNVVKLSGTRKNDVCLTLPLFASFVISYEELSPQIIQKRVLIDSVL